MSEFLQRLQTTIADRRLLPPGTKVLVAASGGVDSMALLHALHALAVKNRWELRVAHFNHQLRGRASDADERLVRKVAKQLKLPVVVGRGNVKATARRDGISLEMAARELRHEFLAREAKKARIKTIALAHHADDQVELFFLRLLRGAGGEGLAGMKWRSTSPASKKVVLVRPLLDVPKATLAAYAQAERVQFREDASNASSDFLRNRIRNELLPLLHEKYQHAVGRTVLRLMDIIGAEAEVITGMAEWWLAGHQEVEFAGLPVAIQRRIIQLQLTQAGYDTDFELVEQLRTASDTHVNINERLTVAREGAGGLKFRELTGDEFNADELEVKLQSRVGQVEFGERTIRWKLQPQHTFRVPARQAGKEMFDADAVGDDIILRHWRAGDRFQPIGLKAAAKLQDLFMNAKIPALQRREVIVATTIEGVIFWVEGLRIGEQFKLMAGTRRKLVWEW